VADAMIEARYCRTGW